MTGSVTRDSQSAEKRKYRAKEELGSSPRSENWSSVYFPKREALGLKSVQAFPNVSKTNSEAGS